ncbi:MULTISPECIES: Fic family protein [Nocardioides]|uniref:Fic family protein n=1 Tax=Nocardioides vastitatis TaxID=2568655 RepID=A0ABW0ZGP7_9ACTN|nr:Fic family protein [Nocardioides sp.]THJ07783.1 Fic family protein [Nocardioides sp.]
MDKQSLDGAPNPEIPDTVLSVEIAPHGEEVVAWRQRGRGGDRADRTLREITVSLPPRIGDCQPGTPPFVAHRSDSALNAIARVDSAHGAHLAGLSALLLRAESVASSKIENVEATLDDYARARHGNKSNDSAVSMVAATRALAALISSVDGGCDITLDNILAAHHVLMENDPSERTHAGRLRSEQNWIGGSDYSPRGADYVPPPHEAVPAYIEDLLEFANRDDVPVMLQAALVHAQFESIHPFTDGNGRIGRALINTVFRRRGITTSVAIPLASALVAKRESYFDMLAAYRAGDAGPILLGLSRAAQTAAREADVSARRLAEMPEEWVRQHQKATGRAPRAKSASAKVLDRLLTEPFFTTEEMEESIGSSRTSTSDAIKVLQEAGILRPLTPNRKRNQVWAAVAVVDELEDLGLRVASETNNDPAWRDLQIRVVEELRRRDQESLARLEKLARSFAASPSIDAPTVSLKVMTPVSKQLSETSQRLMSPTFERLSRQLQEIATSRLDLQVPVALPKGVLREWSDALARSVQVPPAVREVMEAQRALAESGPEGEDEDGPSVGDR